MTSIIAIYIAVPILVYITVFLILKKSTKDHKKSVQWSIDISTFFFITSVHFLITVLWGEAQLFFIFLFMLVVACVFVSIFWKIKGDINFKKMMKGYWRLNFLLFFVIYLILMVYGVFARGFMFVFNTVFNFSDISLFFLIFE